MKLKFVFDKDLDLHISKIMGFSEKHVLKNYDSFSDAINNSKELYQNSWNEINDDFSDYVKQETGHDWFYPEYICVVSSSVVGFAPSSGWNVIARHWKENPHFMRRTTAHELILTHYLEILKKHYSDEDLLDGQMWALAEIAAWALTSLTNDVKKWWPWNVDYYTNHNYPQLVEIQLKLKDIFLNRLNFDDYIKKGINLIKEYPYVGPDNKQKSPGNIFSRGND